MTAKGMGIAILLNWVITIIWGVITPLLFSNLGPSFTYFILSVLTFGGLMFIIFAIQETKGLSKEQINQMINKVIDHSFSNDLTAPFIGTDTECRGYRDRSIKC